MTTYLYFSTLCEIISIQKYYDELEKPLTESFELFHPYTLWRNYHASWLKFIYYNAVKRMTQKQKIYCWLCIVSRNWRIDNVKF